MFQHKPIRFPSMRNPHMKQNDVDQPSPRFLYQKLKLIHYFNHQPIVCIWPMPFVVGPSRFVIGPRRSVRNNWTRIECEQLIYKKLDNPKENDGNCCLDKVFIISQQLPSQTIFRNIWKSK